MNNITSLLRVNKKLSIKEAQQRINELAKNTANLVFTKHAEERMEKRDFIYKDVRDILMNGIVRKPPIQDSK